VPIPDFQTLMLPLLVHLSDGKEHSNQETLKSLAEHFKLNDNELAQLLPSGLQPLFTNRIAWAKSHLKAAGLIESPRRGYYKIRPAVWRF
jgi:restriction system protein